MVYSKSWEAHRLHLQQVLELLSNHQLFANWKKYDIGKKEVAYLGHVISQAGVAMDQSKISAVTSWPVPTNIRELRGFLGLTGYYRKFVKGYASIAAPLTAQLKKDQFGWSEEATQAFTTLKQAMTQVPVLAMPDFNQMFITEADASGFGVGAVLMQLDHPLAFFSKVLGQRARQKSVYEKELIAIVLSVMKWRQYLLGRKFIIRTNQQSLRFLMAQKEVGSEYQRWMSK